MIRTFVLTAILAIVAVPALAAPPEWTIAPEKSSITFSGTQQGVPFQGKFTAFRGKIAFDENDLGASHAEILVETASASTGSPDRDQDLPRAQWFNAGVFPMAQFVTSAFKKSETGYEAEGKLTIRNRERPVSLPFTLTITENKEKMTAEAHAVGQITLQRLDYDVGTGEWRDTASVGPDVQVGFDIVAERVEK